MSQKSSVVNRGSKPCDIVQLHDKTFAVWPSLNATRPSARPNAKGMAGFGWNNPWW
jgi:hypothetical protein